MKIFNKGNGWSKKVNFVDENNVLLGYDTGKLCYEYAGWFISDEITTKIPDNLNEEKVIDMPNWKFDPSFFEERQDEDELYAGAIAVFRITNGEHEQFIHLFNCHNGYYSHGFKFSNGDLKIREGNI